MLKIYSAYLFNSLMRDIAIKIAGLFCLKNDMTTKRYTPCNDICKESSHQG